LTPASVNSLAFTQQASGEQLMKEGFQVEIKSSYDDRIFEIRSAEAR
jgi:hypothetical protein